MKILKKIFSALILQFVLYLIQFVVVPIIFTPSPTDTTGNDIILTITTLVVGLIGSYFIINKIWYWVISFPLYPLLIKLYYPSGIYGIGEPLFPFGANENWDIIAISAIVLVDQLIAYLIIKIIKKLTIAKS